MGQMHRMSKQRVTYIIAEIGYITCIICMNNGGIADTPVVVRKAGELPTHVNGTMILIKINEDGQSLPC